MDVVAAESVYLAAQSWWGTGQEPDGGKSPGLAREGVDPAWSSWAWGLVVESVLRPQVQAPLLCPGPLVLQTSPGTETLPGANTAPARYFPALAACPGSSQARLWESSSAGTREGQGGAPSRRPDPESRQLRAGPR